MHQTDIYIRSKTVWIAQSYLLTVCNGLTPEYMTKVRSQYKATIGASKQSRDILPESGKAWRWATINNTFYYAYDNIPDKAPSHYKSQLPSAEELKSNATQPESANQLITTLANYLNNHYHSYLRCYNDCTKQQQLNLAKAAAVTEGALTWIRTNNIDIRKYAFFEQLSRFIIENNVAYLGSNVRVLKRKIESLITGISNTSLSLGEGRGEASITDIIKLPRADNDNASKGYNDDEIRSWILQLRELGQNYTNTYIIRKVQDMCTLTSKPTPKDRWIGGIMEQHNTDFLTAQQRFGSRSRKSVMHRGYQPFQNAMFAGDCWQIDGTRVNLVKNKKEITVIDKDGKETQKTITPHLYIVAVRDVHSGLIVGHHYTINEDHKANYCAIENAVRNVGYLPYELVHDRFPGHTFKPMADFLETLEQWGVKLTVSSDPNSKAQLERWFGTLQTVFMQDSKYYYGQGVKSRRSYAHRSEEYMKALIAHAKAEGWDWDAAVAEADKIVENYNTALYSSWSRKHATVQQSPASLHEISDKPFVTVLKEEDYAFLFGIREALPHRAGLIKKILQGVEYYYRVTDYSLISQHPRFLCCFDYNDLSKVQLYTITDGPISQYLGYAHEEIPAQVYGPNAEWGLVSKRKAVIKDIASFAEQELEYRKAAGDDIVSVIYPTTVKKHQAEAAETAYLNTGMPQYDPADDDVEFDINPQNQY